VMRLDGWKDIGNFLEKLSGRCRSRFTLMRLAQRGPDKLPIDRDMSNRPIADSAEIEKWFERHRYVY